MRTKRGADAIIEKMKEIGDIKTDSGLADFIGVSKVTVASWRKRGSVPVDKCLLFSQKTLSDVQSIIFNDVGNRHNSQRDDVWAIGTAIHFVNRAQEFFLYGDKWQTSLWWGRAFPFLKLYYEAEVFAIAESEDIDVDDAAILVMKAIDTLEPGDMIELLEKRTKADSAPGVQRRHGGGGPQ